MVNFLERRFWTAFRGRPFRLEPYEERTRDILVVYRDRVSSRRNRPYRRFDCAFNALRASEPVDCTLLT